MKISTDKNKIDEILNRGVENVYPSKDFLRDKLLSGEQLTIYLGVDPTGPSLHIGHIIPLIKLRALQKLGHKIIFLIGDFTAMIGDPTDKMATRTVLSREQVLENCSLYKDQASHIIDFEGENPALIKHNSQWLSKMSFADTLELASKVTFAQMIKRDMFQKRIEENKDLFLHEFMYPLMQGYDSVAMDVDGEIGGNDQMFNMLMGRDLLKKMKNKEKFVITTKLLTDSSGKKMGKTEGNMITITDSSSEMFGKIMSWTDEMIVPGFLLCTWLPTGEVDEFESQIKEGLNPRDIKLRLAEEVVSIFYGDESARLAKDSFINTFSKNGVPEDIQEVSANRGDLLRDVLVSSGLVESNGDFRRVVEGGGVSLNEEEITDQFYKLERGGVVKVGKKRFLKIVI